MKINNKEYKITSVDKKAEALCQKRWDSIAKPLHSLGKMEDYLVQTAGIIGDVNVKFDKKALIVMCADNGVVAEGVTQSEQNVTAIVSENFLSDKATAAILCRQTGAEIFPIDIGIAVDTKLENHKIAYGTRNMAKEPAMTREEAERAMEVGIQKVAELAGKSYKIIATGEMGIGNTTTSSALASYFLNEDVEKMTGRGAGLTSKALEKKIAVVRKAIEDYSPSFTDAVDALAALGGFDIAGLAGVFIGGAIYHIPIVMDGFISTTAALTATRICPECADYIMASHVSKEPAAEKILAALGKEAALYCDMCLGEGTGAVTLFPILDLAVEIYEQMSTFEDIDIEAYVELK
ncbi:nicotinate-nucleotide--dimethylbenzimidazole phosphoribosyltransferase [Jingyaoa shaoxingensis]|uniref:Nicotinate-nucleotide--dimethylbenzimidazole phosphoribosyltransferase n=1 Tax=Jingyaoa shaoxingensis TaxID=2763671 RepID=A0ABR7NBP6_9FIRM|nr:nicotinate-nucleotide--dimethylbenzimidazole phosphoribosyltransferase [Jingyaoa shaoxingensis]MBC8573810.1 nicotinate-nucleotide--dimethylbenzimidazole phosphoribosyltransferase [Jingyaoa shaoxingensis]